jgi:hypothetical protein
LGGYRPELPHAGDMEMWMRFALHGAVGVIDADQAIYRIHSNNMHKRIAAKVASDIAQRKAAFDLLFEHFGHGRPVAPLRAAAAEAIARNALDEGYDAFANGDLEGCRTLLMIGLDACPEARRWKLARRLRWMLRLGPQAWASLRWLSFRWLSARKPLTSRRPAPVVTS